MMQVSSIFLSHLEVPPKDRALLEQVLSTMAEKIVELKDTEPPEEVHVSPPGFVS